MAHRLLIVDDDEDFLFFLKQFFELNHFEVDTLSQTHGIEDYLENKSYSCIISDLVIPEINGIDILRLTIRKNINIPVVIITGFGDTDSAILAMKEGAFDYVEKPIENQKFLDLITSAIVKNNHNGHDKTLSTSAIIGESESTKKINDTIDYVADIDAKVLILGDSGTGKELVASEIHKRGTRKLLPNIKINCAAIPTELLESELFGFRRGAFTGAVRDYNGKFLAADGGTLFLDEIADMNIFLQAKLLRVLQEEEIEVLGSNTPRHINVRIIAASNKNLINLIKDGKFREELYHRLNVIKINIPPLRERPEDIMPIAYHFLELFNEKYQKQISVFCKNTEKFLLNCQWPGNVRELKNLIENILIFSNKKIIEINDIYNSLNSNIISGRINPTENFIASSLREAKIDFEKEYILCALKQYDWKIGETAKHLHIHRTNLFKKMQKFKIL